MEKKLEADIVSRMKYKIRTLIPDGTCNIENVSTLLGLGKKTLQRRLQSQGVTFKVLVDNARQDGLLRVGSKITQVFFINRVFLIQVIPINVKESRWKAFKKHVANPFSAVALAKEESDSHGW